MTGTYLNQKVDDGAWPNADFLFPPFSCTRYGVPITLAKKHICIGIRDPWYKKKQYATFLNILKIETPKKFFVCLIRHLLTGGVRLQIPKWHLRSHGSRLKGCWSHARSKSFSSVILSHTLHHFTSLREFSSFISMSSTCSEHFPQLAEIRNSSSWRRFWWEKSETSFFFWHPKWRVFRMYNTPIWLLSRSETVNSYRLVCSQTWPWD